MVVPETIRIFEFSMALLIAAGAYEPPKAAKEHATHFHHNPNYVTHFKK